MSHKREREVEILKAAAARLSSQAGSPEELAASYTNRKLDAHDRRLLAELIQRHRTPLSKR